MSIDNRAPQVTTSQLMDWLKTTYEVPSGPSYPQSPNDKEFFFNETLEIYAQYDQSISDWVNLGPETGFEKGNLPTGTNPIELYDTKSTGYAYLFLIYDPDEPAAPLLMTDQGFVVKKDIAVGGNVLSGQGAFILGYGWTGSGSPTAYSPPLIELMNSTTQIQSDDQFPTGMNNQPRALFNRTDQGKLYIWSGSNWILSEENFSGYYDTLFLVKNDGYSSANLHLDNLTVEGSDYGIVIDDVNLYRSATGRLKTDGIFEAESGALLRAICIGSALYGMIPYPEETIQLDSGDDLRFCFGTNERMLLTNTGRLELPVQGSSGGLRIGDVNLYRDSAYTLRLQNNLIVEQSLWCSDLAVDNDIGVSGKIGVGTSPSYALHVVDNSVSPEIRVSSTKSVTLTLEADTDNITETDQPRVFFSQDSGIVTTSVGYLNGENAFSIMQHYGDSLKLGTNNTVRATLTSAGQLQLAVSGSSGGLKIGDDVNLYRSAQDVLKTDDSFVCSNISGNDAIFNSVKGTYSGAAVKAGDYLTLSWNGTYSQITAHGRHLQLNTDVGKNVTVYRDLSVGGKIYINSDPNILTSDDDMLFYKANGSGQF